MQLSFSVADAILKISTDMKNTRYAFAVTTRPSDFPFVAYLVFFSVYIYHTF